MEAVIDMEEVPPSLVINWNHTEMKIVPLSQWTMEKRSTKCVEIAGIDDKHQITAVFACTMSSKFLPMLLIYKGITQKCLPKSVDFPSNWDVIFTSNHRANKITTIVVIIPICEEGEKLKHSSLKMIIVHWHCLMFEGQCISQVLKILEENNILSVTTAQSDRLQPLDLSVNKPAKDYGRTRFQEWGYGDNICKQLEKGVNEDVYMWMSCIYETPTCTMDDQFAWSLGFISKINMIINGFCATGILKRK